MCLFQVCDLEEKAGYEEEVLELREKVHILEDENDSISDALREKANEFEDLQLKVAVEFICY